jgi:hypothetical protein
MQGRKARKRKGTEKSGREGMPGRREGGREGRREQTVALSLEVIPGIRIEGLVGCTINEDKGGRSKKEEEGERRRKKEKEEEEEGRR